MTRWKLPMKRPANTRFVRYSYLEIESTRFGGLLCALDATLSFLVPD
jgi:hypothetical protein